MSRTRRALAASLLACAACAAFVACHRRAPTSVDELLHGKASAETLPVLAADDGRAFDRTLRARLLSSR